MEIALSITDLRIDVAGSGVDIVDDVNLTIAPGEVLGLVGESGSGKTTVGLAVLGHARRGVKLARGEVSIGDAAMLALGDVALRHARGKLVSYVPQDPSTALNPALRISKQLSEVLEFHNFGGNDEARRARVQEVMSEVLLPSTPEFLRRYPHQLSGGQQQRVGLAMAFACRPSVIVLDEPTTGLDVSTQAHVLTTVRELCHAHSVAALYVTHDLAVVANLADRVAVMYAGRIIEQGPAAELFFNPAHPYTRHLIAAAPDMSTDREMIGLRGRAPAPGRRPLGCSFAPRCELAVDRCRAEFPAEQEVGVGRLVRCIRPFEVPQRTEHVSAHSSPIAASATHALMVRDVCASYTGHQVVHNVDLHVDRGECLALVGESGSGKTTLSRSIGGLHREWTGEILLGSERLAPSARDRTTAQRLRIQYVFQNPYSSLQPRRTVGDSVARPLLIGGASKTDASRKVGEMLERVALTASYANRFPDQLSGGERQRVAIARALVSRPEVLVCDEVTSALDVLVQASIVELLGELRRDLGLAMLFVTHNLPLVASIADQIAVLADGKIVESGPTERVLHFPEAEYTKRLIADTPQISDVS
ncbi:MAG: peptide/nickel transport system ATP-binding protein ddpF [Ilumatobacteraceae bacterium]|jgi:peptide/nickel transport system ATP-binding protein